MTVPKSFGHLQQNNEQKKKGVVVFNNSEQRHSTKSEFRFWTGSKPALGVPEVCNGDDQKQSLTHSLVNYFTNTSNYEKRKKKT